MGHEKLLNLISQKTNLQEADIELCKTYFHAIKFLKNTVIEKEGKIPQYLYFVVSGFTRLFHVNEKGEEITSHINYLLPMVSI